MKRPALAFAIALASLPSPAAPMAFESGNDLFTKCSSDDASPAFIYCLGFVTAIADTMADRSDPFSGYYACFPNGVTKGQVLDVAMQYLRQNPQYRHFSAATLVAAAYAEAFPCP